MARATLGRPAQREDRSVLIEPVGVGGRGRGGAVRTLTTIAAPLVLLVVVVATGVLARDPSPDRAAEAPATSDPVTTRTQEPDATDALAGRADVLPRRFPPRALGLAAQTVDEALSARRAGVAGGDLIAIRGYLTIWPGVVGCIDDRPALAGAPGWRCERTAILRDDPSAVLAFEDGSPVWQGVRGGSHLHPTIFPGVSLGALDPVPRVEDPFIPDATRDQAVRPAAVLVIGRFDDARLADRRSSARHVNEAFVIERLVWADGRWLDNRFARFVPWDATDLDLRTARAITAEALPGGTVILSQNVIGPEMLGALSVDASAAVRTLGEPPDRLWFVRAMTRTSPTIDALADTGGSRRLGWVVLANDGAILALDPSG